MEERLKDGSLVEMGAGEANGRHHVDSATEMMKYLGESAEHFAMTYESVLVSILAVTSLSLTMKGISVVDCSGGRKRRHHHLL